MIELDLRGVPPFARAAFLGFVTLAGCARSEPAPVAGTPPPPAGAAPSADPLADLVAELDALQARADVVARAAPIEEGRRFGAACDAGCVAGVASLTGRRDGSLGCTCRKLESLGVYRLPKAARPETAGGPSGPAGITVAGGPR